MEQLHFEIEINAPAEKVWQVLWNDDSYRKWTSVFSPDSYARTDWKEGGKIYFLNGEGAGMYSIIEKKIEPKLMTFRHQGDIKDGKEMPSAWRGAEESYYLSEENNKTKLMVVMESTPEFMEFTENTFPRALEIIKELSEEVEITAE